MRQKIIKYLLFVTACFATLLGLLGVILPLLPATPFLLPATPFFILALFGFSKSSPKFQIWLLNLPGIGDDLRHWQTHKSINKQRKPVIYLSILISFLISILLIEKMALQLMLIGIMVILLFCMKKLPEH